MQAGQDWCLQCGAGAPGALGGGPGWRTAAAVLGITLLLVVGASVAAYAALNKSKRETPPAVALAKAAPTAATPTPVPTTPVTTPPATTTPTPGTPTTVKGAPPIPLQTPTPKSSGANAEANNALFPPETKTTTKTTTKPTTTTPTKTTTEATKTTSESGEGGSETKTSSGAESPSPILLDTDAASTYNPYNYPPSLFGDPSLAIDGEETTAWTAQVQPGVAPKMAEGLLLDLKHPQKLGSVSVKTTSTGVTVEVYGANSQTPPSSISDPEWKRLVGLKVLKKKTTSLTLKSGGKGYRFIVLWLAKAPASSTAANPGSVSINEFELFPPSK
jgi:hypothetical protein